MTATTSSVTGIREPCVQSMIPIATHVHTAYAVVTRACPQRRLQRWMERLGVQLPAVWQPPSALQQLAATLGLGGALPAAAEQDLAWLAEAADRSKPLAASVHCLCTAP